MTEESKGLRKTSVEDLPFLVFKKIFEKLSSKDRETSMQVCKRWHDIINLDVGVTCYVGKLRFILPGHKKIFWQPLDVIGKIGIDECVFGELEANLSNNNIDNETSCFLLPELISKVTFIGEISHQLFSSIMTPIYWLNSLKIHLIVLLTVNFAKISLRLCCLSCFKVFYTHPEHNLVSPINDILPSGRNHVHMNLRRLLGLCYLPRIKIFEYHGPYFIEKTECFVEGVREFVKNHEKCLKELVLSFPYEWNVPTDAGGMPTNRVDTECEACHLELCSHVTRTSSRTHAFKDWGKVRLSRLVIMCPATVVPPLDGNGSTLSSSWAQKRLNPVWRSLISTQLQLKNLQYINTFEDWKFPHSICINASSHLKTISLSLNSKHQVDGKLLAECVNLLKLTLEGNFFHDSFTPQSDNEIIPLDEMRMGQFLNANQLPPSLQEICLSKLLISNSEIKTIANMDEPWHFPKLKSLQLYQISKNLAQFGLTPEVVKHLLDQPTFSISFWQALNQPSFQSAITKSLQNAFSDPEVVSLKKLYDFCQSEHDIDSFVGIEFDALNDFHVQFNGKLK